MDSTERSAVQHRFIVLIRIYNMHDLSWSRAPECMQSVELNRHAISACRYCNSAVCTRNICDHACTMTGPLCMHGHTNVQPATPCSAYGVSAWLGGPKGANLATGTGA